MQITSTSPEVVKAISKTPNSQTVNSLILELTNSIPNKDEIFLHHLIPGRSGALVFLAKTSSFGTNDIPLVIKVGPKKLLLKEVNNYENYIAPKLRKTPKLLSNIVFRGNEAAIAYELAGMTKFPENIVTYKEVFMKTDLNEYNQEPCYRNYTETHTKPIDITYILHNLFDDLISLWDSVRESECSIFDCYKIFSEKHLIESLEAVQKDIKFSSRLTGDPFILNKIWKVWEKNWPFAKTFKSIIHGDTNCSNILIDTEHDLAILIDFASVKNDGHFLQDLTKIEREIRCRLMGLEKVDFKQLLFDIASVEFHYFRMHFPKTRIAGLYSRFHKRKNSRAYYKGRIGLLEIWSRLFFYFREFYKQTNQFYCELYLSIFFQTLLVTMFEYEDYPGQKVAATNSCFFFKDVLEELLTRHKEGQIFL